MDFIERWLHISPDGGNGASELLIGLAVLLTIITVTLAVRGYFPKNLIGFLGQLGIREDREHFDN